MWGNQEVNLSWDYTCVSRWSQTLKFSPSTVGSAFQRFTDEETGALHFTYWSSLYIRQSSTIWACTSGKKRGTYFRLQSVRPWTAPPTLPGLTAPGGWYTGPLGCRVNVGFQYPPTPEDQMVYPTLAGVITRVRRFKIKTENGTPSEKNRKKQFLRKPITSKSAARKQGSQSQNT